MDGPAVSINRVTQDALARGVGEEAILGAITCLVPILGTARVAAVAPKLAIALGYDLDDAYQR